jgi:hypothetical protein
VDFWWLERFGLTPDQVQELPLNTRDRVPQIAHVADQVAKAQAEKG